MSFTASEDVVVAPPLEATAPGDHPAGRLAVGVVDDAAGFDALEREWDALLERSDASVFQSFEWQRTWWRHFGEGRRGARLHLVTLRAPDGLAAIAPLYVERVLGPLALRRLLFVGHRDSDYLDVLVARGREAQCAEALADHLSARPQPFDVAVLEETPDRSRIGALLCSAFVRRGWGTSRFVQERCPRTALAKTWEETIAGFDIANRREVRRRLRNMQKEHAVELEVVSPGDAVEPSMREFVDMHQERWARDGYWGVFSDRAQADFHCDVAERLARRGWLFLAFLRVDGRRCAVNYGFSFRSTASVYLTGARPVPPALARHSPGRSLHALGMQWAIAQGRTIYDFMRGAEPYKYELGAIDVPNWTVVAYPRHPRRSEAKHALHLFVAAVGRRARREAHALRVASRGGGWLSREVMTHAARATRRALADLQRILGRRREVEPARA
jgi:CelD/BcsL family acetyltransferase involved in cellulose biosynthesis